MKENWSKNSNQMKRVYFFSFPKLKATALMLSVFLLSSCGTSTNSEAENHSMNETKMQKKKIYTCSMHPEIIRNEPGNCPICGMKLIEKIEATDANASNDLNEEIIKPVYQTVVSEIPTVQPEEKEVQVKIKTDGYIAYDTRTEKNIASRYGGRIEKLYVKYVYQPIKKGDILFEIYSPEIITEQENLIIISNDPNSQTLIDAAKKKLLLLGMTKEQIDEVIQTKKAFYHLPVYSPYNGHIHENSNKVISSNITSMSTQSYINELVLKEGMYIQQGQTIFNILDPLNVWAMLKIYSDDVEKIKQYQRVELTTDGLPNKTIIGQIDFIEPIISTDSKILSARVYLDNKKHELKVGMLLKGVISTEPIKGIWIPTKAVLDLGETKIVWLKKNNAFEARKVIAGVTVNNLIQISSGLTISDKVASDAHYLVDSESFIKAN